MRSAATMAQLVRWDFLERTRRYSFLVALLATLFFGYLVITGKWVLRLGEYRGVYNCAWVGSLMGSASAIMLTFVGFYLVKTAVGRDRSTGVGQILAATPIRGFTYVASKFISNFAVLVSMMGVLAAAAVVMQLAARADAGFDLWALLAPFVFICVPVLVIVAAMAVLFESIRWLAGTVGNILFFLIAEFAFINNMMLHIPLLDFGGLGLFMPSMEHAALAEYPGAKLGFEMGFVEMVEGPGHTVRLFHWAGIDWSPALLWPRLLWIAFAVGIVGAAALAFDRFDPARTHKTGKRSKKRRGSAATVDAGGEVPAAAVSWGAIAPAKRRFDPVAMMRAELRLMVKGYHWSWYAVALCLLVLEFALPFEYACRYALPAAWIWPLAMWSGMGSRETRFDTRQLVLSAPFTLSRQLPAVWLCGVLVGAIAGAGVFLRALALDDFERARTLLLAALFVPTLALALGTISGTGKPFEIIYLLAWYVGPVNGLPALDFLGISAESSVPRMPLALVAVTFVLGVIAVYGRRRVSRTR